ncbi:MAG: hypothetical protein HN826_15505, partial [Methylococcales bacterium]|nr:hypothetical protein [Methylococcales bacterium]
AENRNNNLIVNCPDDIGKIESDEFRLRQVLFNLLGNACKFTSNGDVILNIYKQGIDEDECVCFEIRDTGIGMSSNQLKKLFQAFSQADVSISRKFGGTGLGLVISHKFCQLMKGDVCVKSELGVGSVFTVGLPVKVQS